LIDEILEICTTHAWTTAGDDTRINVHVKLNFRHVVFQDLDAASDVWQADNHCRKRESKKKQKTHRDDRIDQDGSRLCPTTLGSW
jgi:hypothetical protein